MMKHSLRKALTLVQTGRLDELTVEQVADLEACCNQDSEATAVLSAIQPARDHLVGAISQPSAAEWDRMFVAIEQAGRVAKPATLPHRPWLVRPGRVASWACAVAAAVGLLFAWRGYSSQPAVTPLPLALNSRIDEIEVSGNSIPLVVSIGGDDGATMIWMLDDTGA